MYFWPNLELTEYEKRFVSPYKTEEKPGVLRRTYKVLLNNVGVSDIPGMEAPKHEGSVQIARRSRIFALTFGGDPHAWRLNIGTASGETFTPRFAGGMDPMVSAMVPGTTWNMASPFDSKGPDPLGNTEGNVVPQQAVYALPLIVDPNWELSPNEQLIFRGTYAGPDPEGAPSVLEIGVHAWEFPGMVIGAAGAACPPRMSGGPSLKKRKKGG